MHRESVSPSEQQRCPRFRDSDVRELVRASRAAQGLPECISDPSVLARLAVLIAARGDCLVTGPALEMRAAVAPSHSVTRTEAQP